MRLLIVKMTSLGDVVHMLPAVTEAASHIPDLRVDWVAEAGFAAIPSWHSAVEKVIPSALRRWRHQLFQRATWREIAAFRHALQAAPYDMVLDGQGLLKSSLVALQARGPRVGLDWKSAREPLASLFYRNKYPAMRKYHAITRNRLLMAQALGYEMGAEMDLHYGVTQPLATPAHGLPDSYVLCLHGTARAEKEYPEADWIVLLRGVAAAGLGVALPWGNAREKARAEHLAEALPGKAVILPRQGLDGLSNVIAGAKAVVGVDTGLMHLAAAFKRPGVGLYPATSPERFGAWSEPDAPKIINLAGEKALRPENVIDVLAAAYA